MTTKKLDYIEIKSFGVFIAIVMILSWLTSLLLLLQWRFNYASLVLYIGILIQIHLYTGLFITAHDAMHGTVSSNKILNNTLVG